MGRRGVHSVQAPDPRDLGDALRTVFGSRAEVTALFRELEAQMVARMRAICERAKQARRAESPLREDALPAADSDDPSIVKTRPRLDLRPRLVA